MRTGDEKEGQLIAGIGRSAQGENKQVRECTKSIWIEVVMKQKYGIEGLRMRPSLLHQSFLGEIRGKGEKKMKIVIEMVMVMNRFVWWMLMIGEVKVLYTP